MEVEVWFCQVHQGYYYIKAGSADRHADCKVEEVGAVNDGKPFKLEWAEVIYYLGKLRKLRKLFSDLRIEML